MRRTRGWSSEAKQLEARGRLLTCTVCGHDRFRRRTMLLNTSGLTFLRMDYANRTATACRCDACDHIMLFADD